MILTSSSSSVKEPANDWRRYSDLPPSYDAVEAEPDAFFDRAPPTEPLVQPSPEPPAPEDSWTYSDPLTPNRMIRNPEPTSFYLDPSTGEPSTTYIVSDALFTQCTEQGHIEKTKFGTLSIVAAAVFFPWGLLCLMGSRIVYCERCGLVLRAPRGCKANRGENPHKQVHH